MNIEALREMVKDAWRGSVSYEQSQARSLNVIAETLVSLLEIMEKQQENNNGQ